jgi:hypothetical protein
MWGSFGDKLIPVDTLGIERGNPFSWPPAFRRMSGERPKPATTVYTAKQNGEKRHFIVLDGQPIEVAVYEEGYGSMLTEPDTDRTIVVKGAGTSAQVWAALGRFREELPASGRGATRRGPGAERSEGRRAGGRWVAIRRPDPRGGVRAEAGQAEMKG